jgi:hypothetical protein
MKAYGGTDEYTHVFLTWALVGGKWSASSPGRFTLGERASGTHSLCSVAKKNILFSELLRSNICCSINNKDTSGKQPTAREAIVARRMFQFDTQGNLKQNMFLFINYHVLRSFSKKIDLCNFLASMTFKIYLIKLNRQRCPCAYPLDRSLGGPQSRSGRRGEENILDPIYLIKVSVIFPYVEISSFRQLKL